MEKRFKYLVATLAVTSLTLLATAAPPRAEAVTKCNMISCTNSVPCNVPACGDAGFCSNHHCLPL